MKHIKDFSLNEDKSNYPIELQHRLKYPELNEIVEEMARSISREINKRVKSVQSEMPYKAQYVLEELIKRLEKNV